MRALAGTTHPEYTSVTVLLDGRGAAGLLVMCDRDLRTVASRLPPLSPPLPPPLLTTDVGAGCPPAGASLLGGPVRRFFRDGATGDEASQPSRAACALSIMATERLRGPHTGAGRRGTA